MMVPDMSTPPAPTLSFATRGTLEKPALAVVLCHGFGAPGDDLVPLGESLAAAPGLSKVRFYFPEGPLSLGGPYGGGRAWWMIPPERLLAMQRGRLDPSLWRKEKPDGLAPARKALQTFVDRVQRETGLPFSKLVLGGFSQGAMVTCDLALRLEEPPAALLQWSGTLLCEDEWKARAQKRKGLRVLQSHGREDPILPFENAEALRDLLTQAGLSVDFLPFSGGHTIPPGALAKAAALMGSLAAQGP